MTVTPVAATTKPPVADWFDPYEMVADPYPAYARLRELGPIVHVPSIDRYLLTTHASVSGAEQQPEIFSSFSTPNTMVQAFDGRPMLRKDDPEHGEERRAINPTLRPRQITQVWSPRFAATVDYWIDRLEGAPAGTVDLNRDFAAPVASQNLIDIVGFPADVDVADMHRWSTDYIAGIGNILDDADIWARCERSRSEVNAVLDDLLPRLRREPDSSVTSHLLQVGLTEEVVRANVHLTISGGMNEPQHMITNMVWALATHPEQQAQVLSGEVEWGSAFEETVRWISPIGLVPRQTRTRAQWLGFDIPSGASVGLLLASANRDTAVFDHPDEFDITRNARGHLGFGAGVHMCAGRWVAKNAVGDVALPRLFERVPDLTLDTDRAVTWDGWVFRGITSLPVTW